MPTVKKQPMRMCVSCREMREKRSLLRLVKGTSGELFIDETGKAPGRGAYICRSRACMERSFKTRAVERALDGRLSDALKLELLAIAEPLQQQ